MVKNRAPRHIGGRTGPFSYCYLGRQLTVFVVFLAKPYPALFESDEHGGTFCADPRSKIHPSIQIYVGKLGSAYFHDTIVAGQTDFLYGFGTLYVSKSLLSLRNCGGGITAWKGTNTTSPSSPDSPPSGNNNKYGVYISQTQFRAANSTIAPSIRDKCSLGRPWNDIHRSVIMRSYLDASILPQGYTGWTGKPPNNNGIGPETVMAVYDVSGPGYDKEAVAAAANVTKVFDRAQARPYLRPADVFVSDKGSPDIKWLDPVAWLP